MTDHEFIELCKSGSLRQIEDAIKNGADVNAEYDGYSTPLKSAAGQNTDPNVITALIKAGAEVDVRDGEGTTPLMWAASNSSPEVITALIEANANVNAQDNEGRTPLIWAVKHNADPKVIMILLKFGTDPLKRDKFDKLALDYANENKYLGPTRNYAIAKLRGISSLDKICAFNFSSADLGGKMQRLFRRFIGAFYRNRDIGWKGRETK